MSEQTYIPYGLQRASVHAHTPTRAQETHARIRTSIKTASTFGQ